MENELADWPESLARIKKNSNPDIRDGDGDGLIYDGTPDERAAPAKLTAKEQGKRRNRWDEWKNAVELDAVKWTGDPSTKQSTEWTVAGRKFISNLYATKIAKLKGLEYSFTTESGNDKITGKGDAYAVMRSAVVRAGSALKENRPPFMHFAARAGEKSRVDLYRFLTKRAHKLFDNYVGVEVAVENFSMPSVYNFAIVRSDLVDMFRDNLPEMASLDILSERPSKKSIAAGLDYEELDEAFWDRIEKDLVETDDSDTEQASKPIKKSVQPDIRDGDGDGLIYDGTEHERAAPTKSAKSGVKRGYVETVADRRIGIATDLYRNPTTSDLRRMAVEQRKRERQDAAASAWKLDRGHVKPSVRGFLTADNVYVWDAYTATHPGMSMVSDVIVEDDTMYTDDFQSFVAEIGTNGMLTNMSPGDFLKNREKIDWLAEENELFREVWDGKHGTHPTVSKSMIGGPGCGANSKGGHGFQPGNTCASGRGGVGGGGVPVGRLFSGRLPVEKQGEILDVMKSGIGMKDVKTIADIAGVEDWKNARVSPGDIESMIGDVYDDWWVVEGAAMNSSEPEPIRRVIMSSFFYFRAEQTEQVRKEAIDRVGDATVASFVKEGSHLQYAMHPSTRYDGQYQLTTFGDMPDGRKSPYGHADFETKEEAIEAAVGVGDHRIGSVEYQVVWTSKDGGVAPIMKSFTGDKWARKLDGMNDRRGDPRETVAAGLCVVALDTGRVLMLQRSLDDDDPASGKWEFPGGHVEDGEDPFDAAVREWEEETGMELPDGQISGWWMHGIYEGYLWSVGEESEIKINPPSSDRKVLNPDDPDGDAIETVAWWDVLDLLDNSVVRSELQEAIDDVISEVFEVIRSSQPKSMGVNTHDAESGGVLVSAEKCVDNDDCECDGSLLGEMKKRIEGVMKSVATKAKSTENPRAISEREMTISRLNGLSAMVEEASVFAGRRKSLMPEVRDGDGDGLIYDGTIHERAVDPTKQRELRKHDVESEVDLKQSEDLSDSVGKVDDTNRVARDAQQKLYDEEEVDNDGIEMYDPDLGDDYNGDGIPDVSRVGVPADDEPPPPKVRRLPNLTRNERQVEGSFAEWYESDPDGAVESYRAKLASGEIGDAPNIFATDDAKLLHQTYVEKLENRSIYNLSLHQTANAIAKKAFVKHLDEVVMKLPEDQRTVLVTAGGVACHGIDTPIVMYDGEVRSVQDVGFGDQVMGPDSTPRTVIGVHRGRDQMYEITPVSGDAFTANGSHVLCVRSLQRRKVNGKETYAGFTDREMTVNEFLGKSKRFQENALLYRVGVEFERKEVPLDPYFLGLWLGDVTSCRAAVTTADEEVAEFMGSMADSYDGVDLVVRDKTEGNASEDYFLARSGGSSGKGSARYSHVLDDMRSIGVLNNKHIPQDYLVNDRETRLKVFAGLLDSDGSYDKHKLSYEYTTKLSSLASQIQFLARSLGFQATMREREIKSPFDGSVGTYYRLHIGGNDLDCIPTVVGRKRAEPRPAKQSTGNRHSRNALHTGFTIKAIGEGDYYGFTLDGDHLYLLGDFTVTHNSGKGFALQQNEKVSAVASQAAAVWDSAGEQNSTEMPWVMKHLESRGIKGTFVYVNSDPDKHWANPKFGAVERAKKKGRMVDARLFADSYTHGAKNFKAFHDRHRESEKHQFFFIDSSSGKPTLVNEMPSTTLNMNPDELHERSVGYLLGSDTPGWIKRGGSMGLRVWKKRKAAEKKEAA